MMDVELESEISKAIEVATGVEFGIRRVKTCGGGCINDAVIFYGDACNYFVKLNAKAKLEMFVAESAGLEAMNHTNTIHVPGPDYSWELW